MPCACAPALLQLRREVDERWPSRDRASDGCCGDQAHRARKSDHNPTGGYAHALDIDEDIAPGLGPAPLLPLAAHLLADGRTKYVIYEATIWYRACNTCGPGRCRGHRYTGANSHALHLHLSIHTWATHDTRPWLAGWTHPEEDPLAKFTEQDLRRIVTETVVAVLRSEGITHQVAETRRMFDADNVAGEVRRNLRRIGRAVGAQEIE